MLKGQSRGDQRSQFKIEGAQCWIKFGNNEIVFYIVEVWPEENQQEKLTESRVLRDSCSVKLEIPCLSIKRALKVWLDSDLRVKDLEYPEYSDRLNREIRELVTSSVYSRSIIGLVSRESALSNLPSFVWFLHYLT